MDINFEIKDGKKYYRTIRAYLGNKYVGCYRIKKSNESPLFNGNIVLEGSLEVFMQEKGIAKKLIEKLPEVFKKISQSTNKRIEDHVIFNDENAKTRLEHIYLEKGYKHFKEGLYIIFNPL